MVALAPHHKHISSRQWRWRGWALPGPPSPPLPPALAVSPQVFLAIQSSLIGTKLAKKLSDRNWELGYCPPEAGIFFVLWQAKFCVLLPAEKISSKHFEYDLELFSWFEIWVFLFCTGSALARDWFLPKSNSLQSKLSPGKLSDCSELRKVKPKALPTWKVDYYRV
jgi:hypothetical protein